MRDVTKSAIAFKDEVGWEVDLVVLGQRHWQKTCAAPCQLLHRDQDGRYRRALDEGLLTLQK